MSEENLQEKKSLLKNKKFIIILIVALCACLGLAAWLITTFGNPNATSGGGVHCAEDRCNGFYINGICSDNDTHYEPAANNDGYYEITNAGQFFWFGAKVNAGENEIKGRLLNDIDLEKYVWTPIGGSTNPFGGTFDGGGYTINNLNVQADNACEGLFGYVTGIVRNFTVYGDITATTQSDDKNGGLGVIGYASSAMIGKIESHVNVTVGPKVTEVSYVGGIVGDMSASTISQSIWYGTIDTGEAAVAAVGGVAGHIGEEETASLTDCAAYGTIKSSVNGTPILSGIVGYVNNDSAVLYNCIFAGGFELGESTKDTNVSAIGKLDAISTATNCLYYLQGSAPKVQIGKASLDEGVHTDVTAEDLKSGKVAWLLNGKTTGGLWKQTIGEDAYPNFKGEAVTINFGGTSQEIVSTGDKDGDVPVFNNGVYEIYNAKQLFWFAAKVNGGDKAIDGKLMNDIDLEKQEWTAIGSANNPYGGTFDGGGFAIRDLNVKADAANEGFFGYVSGGTVKNFTVYGDIVATMTQATGEYSGLGVIGCAMNATITEIQSCVEISSNTDVTYFRYVGGIVGYQKSTDISKCIWWGNTNMGTTKTDATGGISGYNYGDGNGSITDCASYGTMESSISGTVNLSGIIGYINNPNVTIKDCIFAGSFELSGDTKDKNVSAVGYLRNVKELSNVYYEEGSAPNVRGGEAVLEENAIVTVTADELENNAAVERLNGKRTKAVWEQLKEPAYPGFAGMTPPEGYPVRPVEVVYKITNANQFFEFAKRVNSGENNISAKLMNDIYLENKEWTPIGNKENPYKGTFDGGGFSIWDLNVEAETPYEGLFGYVSGGTVKNFTVHGKMKVAKTQEKGEYSCLGVIGYADNATVSEIYSCLAITAAEDVTYFRYVGGIVGGQKDSAISKCIWWGSIDMGVTKTDQIGGIVGYGGSGESSITDCASYGTFKSSISGTPGIGGIIGYVNNKDMTVSDCLFAGRFNLGQNTKSNASYAIGYLKSIKEVSNVYYEKDSAPTVKSGEAALQADALKELTEGQLRTGEVATYLNRNRGKAVWEQLTGAQLPTIVGKKTPEGYPTRIAESKDDETEDDETDESIVESKEYEIYDADQLFAFAQKVNAGETNINAKLMNDIDLDNREWTLIGSKSKPFAGTFDGNGKTIKNLKVETSTAHEGLIGYVSGGTVKDFTVYGTITADHTPDKGDTPGLGVIGYAKNATISGIESYVNINFSEKCTNYRYVGGIVGVLDASSISKCILYGEIDLGKATADEVGGIVGYGTGSGSPSITDCACYGTLKSNLDGKPVLKGIISYINNASLTMERCLFAGKFELGEDTTGNSGLMEIGRLRNANKVSRIYYLDTSAPNAVTLENDASNFADQVTTITDMQLKSGEVVWLLNGSKDPGVWKQSSNEELPNFKGKDVPAEGYAVETSKYEAAALVNGVYEISNASQFFWFAEQVNAGENNINGKLMSDINLAGQAWTAIGNETVPYKGSFDGNGKAIMNLKLETSTAYEGLFGLVDGGTVKNFTIDGEIKITTSKNDGQLGVIGCAKNATISGIKSSVNITVDQGVNEYLYVGGIVGNLSDGSTVEKCIWYGSIDEGNCAMNRFAGIAGRMGASTVNNCASYGTLKSSNTTGDIQGVVGWVNNAEASISNCLFAGTMEYDTTSKMQITAIADVGNNCDVTKLSNLYYLNTYAQGLDNAKYSDKAAAVTDAQLKSGEAAWLLNGSKAEGVWKQDKTATLPTFEGETVTADRFAGGESGDGGTGDSGESGDDGTGDSGSTGDGSVSSGDFDENGFATLYQPAVLNGDVYEISNAGQLFWFAAKVNAGETAINGKLMKDINLNNREWTPIGISNGGSGSTVTAMNTTKQAYRGTFDGAGYTISGLNLKTTAENGNAGLFGLVIGGTVKDFTVQGEIRVVNDNKDNGRLGVIGYADYATISRIESSVNITVADNVTAFKYVGGIVGDLGINSTAEQCVWYGTIDAGNCKTDHFAGIVGRTGPSTITNCASYGTLKSSENASGNMHGIVGWANHADLAISNCLFAGTINNNSTKMKVSAIGNIGGNVTEYSKLSNLYYQEGSAPNAIWKNGSTAPDALAQKVTTVTAEALSNGQAVLLLNQGSSEAVWKQDTFTIPTDTGTADRTLPGFEGETVASGTKCAVEGCTGFYNENGFCSANDAHYEAVTASAEGIYEISNGGQLFSFAEKVNAGDNGEESIKGTLLKDVDLENRSWTSIGSASKPFEGVFDGDGYTINGLKLTTTAAENEGLFGYVLSSTVKNFSVNGEITVAVSQSSSKGNLGVIGYAGEGTIIQKITSSVTVTVDKEVTNGAYQYVGGIVGNFAGGFLEQCIWDGSIDAGNWTINRFAGIAGRMGTTASITNCASYGTLKSSKTKNLQGIAGWASNPGGIRNSLFAGTMTYEGEGNANYYAIASVGGNCTADQLTALYYVNENGHVAGYHPTNPTSTFSNATGVTSAEIASRKMVWMLNGNTKGNWRYNTTNNRPEFVGEEVTSEPQ